MRRLRGFVSSCRRSRLAGDERGSTIVEFAMVIVPLLVVILGFFDVAHRMYITSVLEGALHEATRQATIGNLTTAQVDQIVKDRMKALVPPSGLEFKRLSYSQFTGVGKPEVLVTDNNGNGRYDPGDCWIDSNPNGSFDTDAGATGLGGADDIFYYQVKASYNRLVPLGRLLGWPQQTSVTENTMMRNQPYAGRAAPPRVCG